MVGRQLQALFDAGHGVFQGAGLLLPASLGQQLFGLFASLHAAVDGGVSGGETGPADGGAGGTGRCRYR